MIAVYNILKGQHFVFVTIFYISEYEAVTHDIMMYSMGTSLKHVQNIYYKYIYTFTLI